MQEVPADQQAFLTSVCSLQISASGEVLEFYDDPTGKVVHTVTNVEEYFMADGTRRLFLGSVTAHAWYIDI